MSSDLGPLRKIFKDETNRKALFLLNEKGALTFDEFMEALNVTPGMFAYHLKVLNDFLEQTDEGKYVLSEKGKQTQELLTKLPENLGVSRRWKITWLISIVSNIVIASILAYISNRPQLIITVMLFVLSGLGLSYALKVKPKITGRLVYIALGAVLIGCALFLLYMKLFLTEIYFARFPPGSTGDNINAITSFVICYVIGGVVGELIGRKMHYNWPPSRIF